MPKKGQKNVFALACKVISNLLSSTLFFLNPLIGHLHHGAFNSQYEFTSCPLGLFFEGMKRFCSRFVSFFLSDLHVAHVSVMCVSIWNSLSCTLEGSLSLSLIILSLYIELILSLISVFSLHGLVYFKPRERKGGSTSVPSMGVLDKGGKRSEGARREKQGSERERRGGVEREGVGHALDGGERI